MNKAESTDLRTFLAKLQAEGKVVSIEDQISLTHEIGALCRQLADAEGPAAILNKIEGSVAPFTRAAVNVYGTRERFAMALGVSEADLLSYVSSQIGKRIEPVLTKLKVAPCQEVVIPESEVDLTKLPIPLWNEGDGGPYITAGLWIAPHPEFGLNIAHHRGQIYGPKEMGVCVAPDHHLRIATDEARGIKKRVEAAVVIGARPSITLAAASDFAHGDYELAVAGALEGRAIETVKCKTVDIDVPFDTEIVIEGYFDGETRSEGPFVEFTGYQTPIITSPVFHVTCITHRKDPIFHGVFAGAPPCETNTLWRELEEAEAFVSLRKKFPMLIAVHRPPQVGRDFWGVLQVDSKRYREGMTMTLLMASAAVMPRLKFVIAIDEDIDIYDMNQVIWAVSTRCDPKADIQSVMGTMTSFLDPASGGLTGKMLIDATRKPSFRGAKPKFPDAAMDRAKKLIDTATAQLKR